MTKELSDIPQNQRGPCMSKHPSAGAVLLILCHHTNLQKNYAKSKNPCKTQGMQQKYLAHSGNNMTWQRAFSWTNTLNIVEQYWTYPDSWCTAFSKYTRPMPGFQVPDHWSKKKMVRKKHCLLPLLKHPTGSEIERGGRWILEVRFLCKPWYLQCFLTDDSFAEDPHFISHQHFVLLCRDKAILYNCWLTGIWILKIPTVWPVVKTAIYKHQPATIYPLYRYLLSVTKCLMAEAPI